MPDDNITFTITNDEYMLLLLMMGYATGAASTEKNLSLLRSFLRLANSINKDNPRWIPYEVPEEQKD